MINVYVRDQPGENSQFLGEFEPIAILQLPDLFKTFRTFVAATSEEGFCGLAQFVIGDDETFFEIVIEPEQG